MCEPGWNWCKITFFANGMRGNTDVNPGTGQPGGRRGVAFIYPQGILSWWKDGSAREADLSDITYDAEASDSVAWPCAEGQTPARVSMGPRAGRPPVPLADPPAAAGSL